MGNTPKSISQNDDIQISWSELTIEK